MRMKIINPGIGILLFLIQIIFCGCNSGGEDKGIIIENNSFRYEISRNGENLHFTDKTSGTDYLDQAINSSCASVVSNGKSFNASTVSRRGKNIYLEFKDAGIKATLRIDKNNDGVQFEVTDVTGSAESLTFINIPLKLEGMPDEPFAACALSMNLFTRVRELPALQSHLWATCYNRFGLIGAKAVILGVPGDKILPAIRNVMTRAEDVPFSDKGGAWALTQKEGYGSYLMNFGTLTESSVEEWIEMCKNLGFNQIDNHGGGDFFKFGDFELNKEKWPDGWESYKRINDRLHEAGISSIFHTYAFFIDKNSHYVTPVPSTDLGYFSSFTLAEPINENDSVIVVNESTSDISTITGFFVRNSLSLRIGTELIEFRDVTKKPPYKFTGCRRGANGTTAASFQSGEKIYHLREMFGRFVPGPETDLFDEIARHTAEIVSNCGFDGVYFDAIDGSDILGGEENFWYYGTKFIFEVAKQLKHPVGMEMSSMAHHWWHYRSRWQAWDRPVRGYKRFEDIHLAAIKSTRLFYPAEIKSNENEHGLWRGHSPLIDKYAPAENGSLMLPLHLGWWGNQTWNPPQVEPTFEDDIEYLCCKMIGNNAGLSMLGGADKKTLEENPLFGRLAAIIRQYEELRHQNYFNESTKALLRQPGKEFTLFKNENGKWNFKPVTYQKHKIAGLSHPSSKWSVKNEFKAQPVMLRIEPLMSVTSYNDPSNIVLADFSNPSAFVLKGSEQGVSGGITGSNEKSGDGGKSAMFRAGTSKSSDKEGLWIKMEKSFIPGIDLNKNQALGVWVKGDGNGELLNLRLESPENLSHGARGDHFIKIDFTGWKYFELVEIESSEFSNYIWPDSGFYVYDSYRHTVLFNNIDKLQLWYNNIPALKGTSCLIGTIKALQMVPLTISDPAIIVNGVKLVFPVKMESGMYLEFRSKENCKLFGRKGEFLQDVRIDGNIPELKTGENELSFSCGGPKDINIRVQLSIISEGNPL